MYSTAIAGLRNRTPPAPRGLDRALIQTLIGSAWIDAHDNLKITGPTGVGKS
jgi:hypothetical protein